MESEGDIESQSKRGSQGSQVQISEDPPQYGTTTEPLPEKECNPCCCELEKGNLCTGICGIIFYSCSSINGISFFICPFIFGFAPVYGVSIGTGLCGLTFAILLTVGVVQKSATFVKVAFYGYLCMFVLTIAAPISLLVILLLWKERAENNYERLNSKDKETYDTAFLALEIASGLIIVLILVFFIWVIVAINAYAQQLTRTGGRVSPMGQGGYGQFPVSQGYPTPQGYPAYQTYPAPQPSYYQPSAPNQGYSQETMLTQSAN